MQNGIRSIRRRLGAGRVTLKHVADRAGVAPITVSRTLSDPGSVSPGLRASVNQAVEELGYVRNRFAGALASAASPIIPVVVPTLDSPVFVEVIESVQAEIEPAGYELLLGITQYDLEREAELMKTLLGWSPAGLVIIGCRHLPRTRRMLDAFRGPLVEIMELGAQPIDVNIGLSQVRAGAAMGAHLIERGRREIGFVGAQLDLDYRGMQRFRGLDRVLAANRLRRRPPIQFPGRPNFRTGGDWLVAALDADPALDALFFTNDDLAIGAILRARREGIAVPERIAIAGFNGLDMGALLKPSLTTIVSPRREMGTLAAQKLLARIRGEQTNGYRIDLGYELAAREST